MKTLVTVVASITFRSGRWRFMHWSWTIGI